SSSVSSPTVRLRSSTPPPRLLPFPVSFECSRDHRDLHSFPTRRSSDLVPWNVLDHLGVNPMPADKEEMAVEEEEDEDDDVPAARSEEHTSELQSRENLVCRLLLE